MCRWTILRISCMRQGCRKDIRECDADMKGCQLLDSTLSRVFDRKKKKFSIFLINMMFNSSESAVWDLPDFEHDKEPNFPH